MISGFILFVIRAVIALALIKVASWIGLRFLRIQFLSSLGALTGGMARTPRLAAATPMTDSNAPQVAYTAVYPVALVLLIIISHFLSQIEKIERECTVPVL